MATGYCDGHGCERPDVRSCGRDANGDPDAPDLCFLCRKGGGEALPTISTLLREAMAAALLAAGIPPSSLPPPPAPSRTSRATAARSRQRIERSGSQPSPGPPSPAHEAYWHPGPRCPGCAEPKPPEG